LPGVEGDLRPDSGRPRGGPDDWAADLALMREAAREAGRIAQAARQKPLDTRAKADNSPVTAADLAVNRFLQNELLGARGAYGWLSEETADDPDARSQPRVFVVDPIDGTVAYIKGEPFYCIAIARVDAHKPTVGVLYAPEFDELYEAVAGGGAWLNGQRIGAGATDRLQASRMIGDAPMFAHPAWPEAWPAMELAKPKPNSIAYRLALVARGEWDAALALSWKGDWDLAAASLLVSEAGGAVSDHRGASLAFNGLAPRQPSVVACTRALHPELIRRVCHVEL